ncbi:MAG: aminoglycoside 6-adenylyltransferase [Pyrinomonadaceae bacterium]
MSSMNNNAPQAALLRRIVDAAAADRRIVGVVDYGSTSEARADEWSDIDLALFIRDADYAEFERDWQSWATQFGQLLLAYIGGIGHPWTVYDTEPLPLRVDFAFHRESAIEVMLTWPNAPASVAAMVKHDATGGRISACAAKLVGQALGPPDPARAFEQVAGDVWYYLLRTYSKLRRNQLWAARFDLNFIIIGNLLALLRMEAGATARLRSTSAAVDIEQALAPERLAQLNALIPGADEASLRQSFVRAIELTRQVCAALAQAHGWSWPEQLAARIATLFDEL